MPAPIFDMSLNSGVFASGWYSASMCAMTTLGLLRAIASPILPVFPVGNPFVILLNVLPPSVVLKMPPLAPPLSRFHAVRFRSQNPTYSVFGLLGSIRASMAPVQPSLGRLFDSFVQVFPPSMVLKNPRSPSLPQRLP